MAVHFFWDIAEMSNLCTDRTPTWSADELLNGISSLSSLFCVVRKSAPSQPTHHGHLWCNRAVAALRLSPLAGQVAPVFFFCISREVFNKLEITILVCS